MLGCSPRDGCARHVEHVAGCRTPVLLVTSPLSVGEAEEWTLRSDDTDAVADGA